MFRTVTASRAVSLEYGDPVPSSRGCLHCAGDSVNGDLRTGWGETSYEVQANFLTLILGRMHHRSACRILAQHAHTILPSAFCESMSCVWDTARWIMQQEQSSRATLSLVWYYAPYSATTGGPRVEMTRMSIILLPVAISTDTSTVRPCALDVCNTARIFIHKSNTCVIRRLAFLNLGFIERLFLTLLPATSGWGYRDSARLLGELWWQKNWGAMRGKNLHKNREIVGVWTVRVVGA